MLSAFISFPALVSRICHFAPFETWVLFALGLSPGISPVFSRSPPFFGFHHPMQAGDGPFCQDGPASVLSCSCNASKPTQVSPLPPECSSAHCEAQMTQAQSASPLPRRVLHPGGLSSRGPPRSWRPHRAQCPQCTCLLHQKLALLPCEAELAAPLPGPG